MTFFFKSIRGYFLAVAALLFLFTSVTAAQQSPTSGLSISPTRNELTLKPTESTTLKIILKNVTAGDIIAKPVVNDFEADNSTGNPKIVTNNPTPLPTSISGFVQGLSDIPLKKGEQKDVTVIIQIPPKKPAGAYYGIIRYQAVPAEGSTPKSGQTSLSLSASVSTIVLVTVPGNLVEKLELKALHVYHNNQAGTFFLKKPNLAGVEIQNLGSSFSKPFGKVVLTNMSGNQVYSYEINNISLRANVLPKSTRIFKDNLKNISSPGRYTLTANISYGAGSDILITKKTFWYIPPWLIIVIIAVIALLIAIVLLTMRRHRRQFHHRR